MLSMCHPLFVRESPSRPRRIFVRNDTGGATAGQPCSRIILQCHTWFFAFDNEETSQWTGTSTVADVTVTGSYDAEIAAFSAYSGTAITHIM